MSKQVLTEVQEKELLEQLNEVGYDGMEKLGYSRGRMWRMACRHGARMNEARIRERAAEKRQRQKEYLMEVLNAVETTDVLDFLEGIPDKAVQLHVTSPPYRLGKAYGGTKVDSRRFHYFLGWTLQVLSEMDRTLADGGVLVLQVGNTETDDGQVYPMDCLLFEHLKAMGLTFQSRITWVKPHGLTPKRRLAERTEVALVFSKGEPANFNANAARIPQKEPGKRAFKGPNKGRLSGNPLGAWPTDVWQIPHVGHNNPEKTGHPAQFPEELVRRAVLLYTMPEDLVCDVFMGSGTTAAVATKTGRSFIGADLFYEDLRAERLSKVAEDLVSELPGVTKESLAVWSAEAKPVFVPAEPQQKLAVAA